MRAGRFFWKLFLGHAALVALVLGACLWAVLTRFDRIHDEATTADLRRWAGALRAVVVDRFDVAHALELDALVKTMGAADPEGVRMTLVSAAGVVLGDSQADPSGMDSHADRPEIRQALTEGWGESVRWSRTVSRDMKYVAVRVGSAERPLGYVRVSLGTQAMAAHDLAVHRLVWMIGLIGLLGAVSLALGLAVLWSGRIFRLTATAHRLSRGDLSIPIHASGSDEVSLLAQSLERMRDRLARQLATIDRQNRMLESLLAQLHEGVMVTASDGRMVLVNPAAARLLSLPVGPDANRVATSGRRVEDCIQQNDLRQMLLPHSAGQGPMNEARLDVPTEAGVRSILARVSEITLPEPHDYKEAMAHSDHPATGRLLVLTDVTELTRTLQLRSDFVANASHELRTPIAAIRAAVDTVLRIDVAGEAEAARRFLEIIARHTSRLEALVGDLLDLSRLESPSASFQPTALRLQRVGDELHDRWSNEIDRKQLRWGWDIADDCPNVFANLYLLQLVLDNLVDNAIKFTDGGGRIGVACRREGRSVEIEVYDTGCGIAPQDHQRVFERFYQVESARSGTAAAPPRGTGLGLSIVKHAVAALGGSVRLDSALGSGTRVTVSIPNEPPSVTHA